jgi:hypothetical protein
MEAKFVIFEVTIGSKPKIVGRLRDGTRDLRPSILHMIQQLTNYAMSFHRYGIQFFIVKVLLCRQSQMGRPWV